MTKGYIFNKGDRVKVISECQSCGFTGTVVENVNSYWTDDNYVTVDLDRNHNGGFRRTYNERSLTLISSNENNNITKGDNKMLMGNYKVATVKFLNGTNTKQGYVFALYDNDINVGDAVLCDTANGYNAAEVISIDTQQEYEGYQPTKEIICKVDFTAFKQRQENRVKAQKLKAEMEKKMQAMQELALYELMAEKSPELKEMLETYKSLL